MNTTDVKNIAERILNDEYDGMGTYLKLKILAKAYLELEKKYYELGEEEIQNTIHLETHLMEIQKRGEEITKLEEKNAGLIETLKFYASADVWHHVSAEKTIYSVIDSEDLGEGEFDFNEITDDLSVGGKRAREALKKWDTNSK